jgi:hypothetical protein
MSQREAAAAPAKTGRQKTRRTLLAYVWTRCAWLRLAARGTLGPAMAPAPGRAAPTQIHPGHRGADRSCTINVPRRSVGPVSRPRPRRTRPGR